MLLKIIPMIIGLVNTAKCALVEDKYTHKINNISDYCTKMPNCPEGTHVMCMYYNSKSTYGSACRNPVKVSLNQSSIDFLLDVTNAIRSKVARGVEKGAGDKLLPRAYGMFRLKWDQELATYAQVFANQCFMGSAYCKSTKKFPDPGQNGYYWRFTHPDWLTKVGYTSFNYKGLSDEKIRFAIKDALKVWYGQKSYVTDAHITKYPNIDSARMKNYLTMIHSPTTHMGCGISAYNDLRFSDVEVNFRYDKFIANTLQLICYYSSRPTSGTAVYNKGPVDETKMTKRCGCPTPDSYEDDDCLCNEHPNPIDRGNHCPNGEVDCDPTVVLLPIITVENAPPEKLMLPQRYTNATIRSNNDSINGINNFGRRYYAMENKNTFSKYVRSTRLKTFLKDSLRRYEAFSKEMQHDSRIRNNDINVKPNSEFRKMHPGSLQVQKIYRGSNNIFTRNPTFKLHTSTHLNQNNASKSMKYVVLPRKDFAKAKRLADEFILHKKDVSILPGANKTPHTFKKDQTEKTYYNHPSTYRPLIAKTNEKRLKYDSSQTEHLLDKKRFKFLEDLSTENFLNTVEQRIITYNNNDKDYLNFTLDLNKTKNKTESDENKDNRLMTLLDTLEREVKHIELRDKDRQIFDAKIKTIYGKAVGKSVDLFSIGKTTPAFRKLTDENFNYEQSLFDGNSIDETEQPSVNYHEYDGKNIDIEGFEKPPITRRYNALTRLNDRNKSYRNRYNSNKMANNNFNFNKYLVLTQKHNFNSDYMKRKLKQNAVKDNLFTDYTDRNNHYTSFGQNMRRKIVRSEKDRYAEDLAKERKRYHQKGLNNVEKILPRVKHYSRKKDISISQHMRLVRPNKEEFETK